MSKWRSGIVPTFAAYESCVRCLKGDTNTALVIGGEAEWLMAGLMALAGLPQVVATYMVVNLAHDCYDCDHGAVPVDRMQMAVRLCRDCANLTDAMVVDKADLERRPVRGYNQPATA